MKLRKSFQNLIYRKIEGVGLNPIDFEIKSSIRNAVSIIYLRDKDYKFDIFDDSIIYGKPTVVFAPGDSKFEERITFDNSDFENDIISKILNWLNNLYRELGEPDLWKLGRESGFLKSINFEDNNPFTIYEQQILSAKLDEIGEKLKDVEISNEELHEKVDDLVYHQKETLRKMGKIDWKNQFIGAMFSFAGGFIDHLALINRIKDIFGLFADKIRFLN